MTGALFDSEDQAGWVVVVGWEKFQHYGQSRTPIWVKTYLDLLDRDEYLELTAGERSLLHGLWLMTARSRGAVRSSTTKLSRALSLKVTTAQLEALRGAGFITFSASKPLAPSAESASGVASAEVEEEKETREAKAPLVRRDDLWDALASELGEPQTRSERSRRGKVLNELRDAGATPGQVRLKASAYRKLWPNMSLTDTALVKHWTTLEAKNGQPAFLCPECGIGFQAELSLARHRSTVHDVVPTERSAA